MDYPAGGPSSMAYRAGARYQIQIKTSGETNPYNFLLSELFFCYDVNQLINRRLMENAIYLHLYYASKVIFCHICWLLLCGITSGNTIHHGWTSYCIITCQNFQFWQVCSSDGLFVCVSVCLSVRMDLVDTIQVAPFDQSSPNLTQIWTLGPDRTLLFF